MKQLVLFKYQDIKEGKSVQPDIFRANLGSLQLDVKDTPNPFLRSIKSRSAKGNLKQVKVCTLVHQSVDLNVLNEIRLRDGSNPMSKYFSPD